MSLSILSFTCAAKSTTRRSMSVHWVACGRCYSKTEGTELGSIELQCSSNFFQVGGHEDHLSCHPEVVPAAKFGGTNKEYYGIFQSGLVSTELRFVFQDIQVQCVALIVHDRRQGGLMVGVLDSGSSGLGSGPGWGHYVVFLGKTLYSHGAFLHPGV